MEFTIENDTPQNRLKRLLFDGGRIRIFAVGTIEADDASKFRSFVAHHKIDSAKVCFDSPGGSLGDGLLIGEAIREFGFDTEVSSASSRHDDGQRAICASASAYAFSGGHFRYFDEKVGRLGLHQFAPTNGSIISHDMTQRVSAQVLDYLTRMGVDASAFVLACKTNSDAMAWLSSSEALSIGLSNNGTLPATAEIKVNQGAFYLKLEQVTDKVTGRILVHKFGKKVNIAVGIVTTPERSKEIFEQACSSYLEFGSAEIQRSQMPSGVFCEQSTLWVCRDLVEQEVVIFRNSNILGAWTENGGPMRWGAYIDALNLKYQISHFLDNAA